MRKIPYILTAFLLLAHTLTCRAADKPYDVVIIGGGTSGIAAGLQSARMGVRTLIVEEYEWLGGMLTSAGVSATDGNFKLKGGIWGEFRDSLEARYGGPEALKTGWVSNILFEPSIGNEIFKNMAAAEKYLSVWYNSSVSGIERDGEIWNISVTGKSNDTMVHARVIIDATELGDIASMLGIPYDKGMDSRLETGEKIAPEHANGIIQDLTYAMILKDYGKDVTIPVPEGYDASLYHCCCLNDLCVNPKESHRMWSREKMITYGKLPNDKYMINWPIEGNDYYLDLVEVPREKRAELLRKAKNHSLGFLYFIQTELGLNTRGLAGEFPTEDGLPFIPYHRESRRVKGAVRFTLNHITEPYSQPQKLYRTTIAVGDYPVDQHHTRYDGWDKLPDFYFHPVPSYGVPLGVMIPESLDGVIVAEKSISVTNLVNGSTRLQPVVLQIGQASGILAALSVLQNKNTSEVSVRDVQRAVLDCGGYLLPYLDLPASHPNFKAMQRIGATGIIKGVGANKGWENQTWFQADSTIAVGEIYYGLCELPYSKLRGLIKLPDVNYISVELMASLIVQATSGDERPAWLERAGLVKDMEARWDALHLTDFNPSRALTRLECAVLINYYLAPFDKFDVTVTGEYIKQTNGGARTN